MLTKLLSCFSRVRLFVTPWTVSRQAPLSMELSRQEYWSGLPFPPVGDLPDSGIEPAAPAWQMDSLPLCHLGSPFLYQVALHKRSHYYLKKLLDIVLLIKINSIYVLGLPWWLRQ